jgi:hypothetical protein
VRTNPTILPTIVAYCGDRGGITTPMHPTVERLSVVRSRLPAAGDWERYTASSPIDPLTYSRSHTEISKCKLNHIAIATLMLLSGSSQKTENKAR